MKRSLFSAVVLFGLLAMTGLAQAVPTSFTFTGRLADSGTPFDGAVTLELALYDTASGGSPLWSETHSTTAANGLVSVAMGGQAALDETDFDGGDLWLAVSANGTALNPRFQIRSVPYAMRSAVCDSADTLGNLGPGDVALASHNHDGAYSPLAHNHDTRYASLAHNHDTSYASLSHNHDTRYYTQATLNTAGTINAAGNPVQWTKLTGVPAGFADGVDADSGGDITQVTAGTGLTGGATSGAATLAVSFGGTGAATTVARSDHNHDGTYLRDGGGSADIIQVGTDTASPVTFPSAFPGTPIIVITPEFNGGGVSCWILTRTTTGFTYACNAGFTRIHWMAVN
ncbi:MAG: hypothetical protein F9K40_06330 [Kofleriaceae bacterium]|nr:MAG: hypothetical protein F9K40_06330 [Kofleriaceae bacterium]MBZ0237165.1 hypothetical protein [Kofleriaceae bacterium]